MIRLKRVYEKPSRADGLRVLVDRLWPRGLSKERAAVAIWLKEVAPSAELRKWFGHDPDKWKEFQARYRQELKENRAALALLKEKASERTVTLLFAARDEEHNEAVVLKKILQREEKAFRRGFTRIARIANAIGQVPVGCNAECPRLSSRRIPSSS